MRQATGHQGRRARLCEVGRYGLVGGTLVAIEYALYLAILAARPDAVLPAYILSRIVASVVGYVGHARFTFGAASLSARSALLYAATVAGNMALATLLLAATLPWLGPLFAKMASDAVVIVAAYLVSRHLVFLSPHREAAR